MECFFQECHKHGQHLCCAFLLLRSASGRLIDASYGTPDNFDGDHHLSLFPTPQTPLGLYLSYNELEDLLCRYPHPLNLADDVKKEILAWTAGHIGAIKYLLESIKRDVRFY